MQQIQTLASKRGELERELRTKQVSFSFVKFFGAEPGVADEMEVWFQGKGSTTYREQVEAATRRVIEEGFGVVLKGGAVLPTRTDRYCILYREGVDCSAAAELQAITEKEEQVVEEGDIWINGFRLYKSKRDGTWKVFERVGKRWNLVYAILDRVEAFKWAANYKPIAEVNHVV